MKCTKKYLLIAKPVIISVMMNAAVFFANLIQKSWIKSDIQKKNPTYAHSLHSYIVY
jgi:hypothetical protein